MIHDPFALRTNDQQPKSRLLVEGPQGRPYFLQPDLIIAATAQQHGLTVVSRDTNDYERSRVPVINP